MTREPDKADDLVREIHNAVANRSHLGEASCRTQATTNFELRLMTRDVIRKLQVEATDRVLEVGCGVGVLGLPVTRRCASYTGLDIADDAVRVFDQRLTEAGLEDKANTIVMDFVAATDTDIDALGTFDKVLAYAALHYVRSDEEGRRWVHRALALTRPGGRLLLGNLPLEDLGAGIWPPASTGRRFTTLRWALGTGAAVAGMPVSRSWRIRHLFYSHAKHRLTRTRGAARPPESLPPGYVVGLSRATVERWIETAPTPARYHWLLPAVGVPQHASRADLIAVCDG